MSKSTNNTPSIPTTRPQKTLKTQPVSITDCTRNQSSPPTHTKLICLLHSIPKMSTPPTITRGAKPTSFAQGLLTTVGGLRVLFGLGCLAAPALALGFIGLQPAVFSPQASLIVRQFGVREIVIGGFLVHAEQKRRSAGGGGGAEIRRAIWWNVATDALDAVAIVAAHAQGSLDGGVVFWKMVGTALVMVAAGVETGWLYVAVA